MAQEIGLQHYLKRINEAPLLTVEEERDLSEKIQRAHDLAELFAEGKVNLIEREEAEQQAADAREQMVKANLRLVVSIAKRYARRGMALADLINEGNLGLIRAVDGFDPEHETRFSTYASWWIKQAIKRSLINGVQPIHIPAYMVEMISRWRQAENQLIEKFGRPPSIEELAELMEIPEKKVRIVRRAVKAFSSPTQSAEDESGMQLTEVLPDDKTGLPEDGMASEDMKEDIRRKLNAISEREATILKLRYGLDDKEPMTLKEIGKQIGLTRERVRQIEAEALRKLSEMIDV